MMVTGQLQRKTLRNRAITVTAVLLAICLLALVVWWHLAPLPVKHRAHADIITQAQALFATDPDHAQQSITRSGKTNITLDIDRDLSGPGFDTTVKKQGLYFNFEKPDDNDASLDPHGKTILVWIGEKPISDPFNPDSVVTVSRKTSTLDIKSYPESTDKLHMSRHRLEDLATQAVWETIDTVADNW
ncbi:hypothetical protein OZX67_05135 [Bifidobacterium sp. ESL0728]|uniref:hypothetical protein n=1 Tax=Bifidobacterium sp. ESL0728 TaxID=2983220 RepID=UPI0023F9D425|nr:hypothetical protein [Bifidobacterium sp. ESL0728]WEV58227.1 hypothetical protein OZX67_05135 [Bifidobacterium sp. ESL0728]